MIEYTKTTTNSKCGFTVNVEIVFSMDMLHRCGYIEIVDASDEHMEILEDVCYSLMHGGVTYHEGNTLGFDCGHTGDTPDIESGYLYEAEQSDIDFAIEVADRRKDCRVRSLDYCKANILACLKEFKERISYETQRNA